jgi:DnaJ-class molecular chaperone
VLRLKGQGEPGRNGGAAGDALITVHIEPHPLFRREGNDIHFEIPVSLSEAVLGGRITVPTPSGPVAVSVPRHSDSGTKLRLRGKGVAAHGGQPAGDAYVTLRVHIGEFDAELEKFLAGWAAGRRHNPRGGEAGAA